MKETQALLERARRYLKSAEHKNCSNPWEDHHLGQCIAEVADDEILKAAEARAAYQSYLSEET